MQLQSFNYTKNHGWSVDSFPLLDSENTVVMAFGSSDLIDHPEPIEQLFEAYPHSKVIGCSSSGEIFDDHVDDDSLSVAVMKFDHTNIATAVAAIPKPKMSFSAGEALGLELLKPDLRAIIVLSDGLNVNGTELIYGINSVLPDSIIVTGGLAGDLDRFQQTWVIQNEHISPNQIVAIGFYGDHVHVSHGSEGGWDIFGQERIVTRSEKNVVFEIDHQPALKLYKEYLGDRAAELPAAALLFPLSIKKEENKCLVRTVLAVSEEDQSMTFAGDIEEGATVQLMKTNFDQLIQGAANAAKKIGATQHNGEQPALAIAISCVGRRLVLGQRTDEELEAVLKTLPKNTQQIGFYSYGEISPFEKGYCDLHNQTMTLTLISED